MNQNNWLGMGEKWRNEKQSRPMKYDFFGSRDRENYMEGTRNGNHIYKRFDS